VMLFSSCGRALQVLCTSSSSALGVVFSVSLFVKRWVRAFGIKCEHWLISWLRETSFSPKLCFFFNIGLALRVLFFSGSIILAMNTSRAPFSA
jgi:hypothetical protein